MILTTKGDILYLGGLVVGKGIDEQRRNMERIKLEGSSNLNPVETKVNRNLNRDVCTNHNYGIEENLGKEVRYLMYRELA